MYIMTPKLHATMTRLKKGNRGVVFSLPRPPYEIWAENCINVCLNSRQPRGSYSNPRGNYNYNNYYGNNQNRQQTDFYNKRGQTRDYPNNSPPPKRVRRFVGCALVLDCQEYARRFSSYSRIFLVFDCPNMQLHNPIIIITKIKFQMRFSQELTLNFQKTVL